MSHFSYTLICIMVLNIFDANKRWYTNVYVFLEVPKAQPVALITSPEDSQHYEEARQCVEELALYLKPLSNTRGIQKTQIKLYLLHVHSLSMDTKKTKQINFSHLTSHQVWAWAARLRAYWVDPCRGNWLPWSTASLWRRKAVSEPWELPALWVSELSPSSFCSTRISSSSRPTCGLLSVHEDVSSSAQVGK